MLVQIDYLVIRYEPALGGIVRAILSKHANLIVGKKQFQEREKVCTVVTPAWPDTDDEGEKTRFDEDFFGNLVTELKFHGISTEMSKKEVA